MFPKDKKYTLPVFAFLMLISTAYLFYLDWQNSHRGLTFAMLDVGQRRAVKLDMFQQRHQPFIHIEEGHVAAEESG